MKQSAPTHRATPSWFDKLTMKATRRRAEDGLILCVFLCASVPLWLIFMTPNAMPLAGGPHQGDRYFNNWGSVFTAAAEPSSATWPRSMT